MSDAKQKFRIFGSELSPYSVKVRSYFRYKRIPHEWVIRDSTNQAEFQAHAKLPLIPLVLTPDGRALQDSTPIIEQLEKEYPEPTITPQDPALAFVSALVEEYGDEWGNTPMFHYRWYYEADQHSAAERLARSMMPGLDEAALSGAIDAVKNRMIPRRARFVGSTDQTRGQIEGSFERQIAILNEHLARRSYLFGGRPALGDFGLAAQLHQCTTDPTPGALVRSRAPNVMAWITRMLDASSEGGFEPWDDLAPTFVPFLRDEIAGVFLPWTAANADAIGAGQKEMTVEIEGKPFIQEAQKYRAKSFGVLRARYGSVADKKKLDTILDATGCSRWLR